MSSDVKPLHHGSTASEKNHSKNQDRLVQNLNHLTSSTPFHTMRHKTPFHSRGINKTNRNLCTQNSCSYCTTTIEQGRIQDGFWKARRTFPSSPIPRNLYEEETGGMEKKKGVIKTSLPPNSFWIRPDCISPMVLST